jgi:hypothetical protein
LKRLRMMVLKVCTVALASIIVLNVTTNAKITNVNMDLNGDGVVDIQDFIIARDNFNETNPLYDINNDGVIDVFDLVHISKSYDPNFRYNDYTAIGNVQGNLLNSSEAVVAGNRVYYRNTQEGDKLYSSKLDRAVKVKLSDDAVSSINVIGNKIFYSNLSDNGRIYSINVDGTGRSLVVGNASGDFVAAGGYLYYKNVVDGNKLYRASYNGTGPVKLSNDNIGKFTIKGDYIYYVNAGDGNKMYRMSIDGANRAVVTTNSIVNFALDNDNIYFVNGSDNNSVYSMNMEGGNLKRILEEPVSNVNVADGVLFYSALSDGRLYTVNTDGSNKRNIQQERVSTNLEQNKFSVAGGWIFYNNAADGNRLYRIQASGNGKRDMDSTIEGRVNTSSLVVKSEACSFSTTVGSLSMGERIEVLSKIFHRSHSSTWEPSSWYHINYIRNGQVLSGFVRADLVLVINDDRQYSWLGVLSGKYESNGDPGMISTGMLSDGNPDPGGKSYGVWQFASKVGTVDNFIFWLINRNENFYKLLRDAKEADGNTFDVNFDTAWKYLSENYMEEFLNLQLAFTKGSYYDASVRFVRNNFGFDIDNASFAYKNVVFSSAVHHGVSGATRIGTATTSPGVLTAVGYDKPEREMIEQVYLERARRFSSLSTRFTNESAEAVKMYDYALQQQK